MDKRGAVEVDWIVSIGIFLVFLAAFFIYLAPFGGEQADVSDALLGSVEENLRENSTWHIRRVPVIIHSNISGVEPIIADFPFTWKNISFSDNNSFFRQEGKLLFKMRLSKGPNMKWIVTSNEPYPQKLATTDLAASASDIVIDSARLRAEFNGLPTKVQHMGLDRVSDFNLSIDETPLNPESAAKESNFSNLAAKYKLAATQLNHTTFAIGDFPRLFNYVTTDVPEQHNVTAAMTLHNYTHYFFDNQLSGLINSSGEACVSKFTDYADFHDGIGGVSIITEEKTAMSFCPTGAAVRFEIETELEGEKRYDLVFHTGDYTETANFTRLYTVRTGLVENVSGLSMELLARVNSSDYENLKASWNFPSQRDFSFMLLNESGQPMLNYTPRHPGIVNTFVREFEEIILDKYGGKEKHDLRIRGW